MTRQLYLPYSFNGTRVDGSGNITALFHLDEGPLQAQMVAPVEATVVNLGDRYVRSQPKASTWLLRIRLASATEDDVQSLYAIFSERGAPAYLVITDGNGAYWRVEAKVLSVEQLSGTNSRFIVTLRVSNPVWEENTATTTTESHMSGTGASFVLNNAGNRPEARPSFTITPTTAKTDCIDDWKYSFRGFVVNPSTNRFKGPLYLFDQNGAAARIDTTTLVKDTTVSNQINNGAGITSTATTIDIDTAVGGGLPARGMAIIGTEQIYYTANSGTQLTGCVRGIGLTTAATHADNTVIYKSTALSDGSDVAVWFNNAQVDRYLVGWNSASTDVVINVDLAPSPKAAGSGFARFAVAAGDTHLPVQKPGLSGMPDSGFCLVVYPAGTYEVVYYGSKGDLQLTDVQRGMWGTTATASNSASDIKYYANPIPFFVAVGKATAPNNFNGLVVTSKRPCIQLPGSSNQTWKWGDSSDDSFSYFIDATYPDRTAQFIPGYDTDGNTNAVPLIAMTATQATLEFTDKDIGEGALPYNQAVIELPQGTAASGNLTADWTPAAEIVNLEEWGRDSTGTWKLLDQLQQTAAATGRTRALTNSQYALKLKGRYNAVTAYRATTSSVVISNASDALNVDGLAAGQFVLDQETAIAAFEVTLARASAGSDSIKATVHANIVASTVNEPDESDVGLIFVTQPASQTVTDTTPVIYRFTMSSNRILPAGTYWLVLRRSSFGANVSWYVDSLVGRSPTRLRSAVRTGGVWAATSGPADLRVCAAYQHDGTAPVQNDQPLLDSSTGARTGTAANFDKLIVPLLNYPKVHRTAGFTTGLYHHAATITNSDTGDSIVTDLWSKTSSPLVIDCEARSVTLTEDGIEYQVAGAITPSNFGDWMPLIAGDNHITYAEANLLDTTLVASHRGTRV